MTANVHHAPRGALGYMPQLDGLRALAVTAVVFHHFHVFSPQLRVLDPAGLGVHLFFVLSGFLITGILVKARDAADAGLLTWTRALRQFYLRRVLRIFPLYYFVVLAAIVVN